MKSNVLLSFTALSAMILFSCAEDRERVLVLKPQKVAVSSPDQIVPIADSLVRPVLYQNIPSFDRLTVDESKQKFIDAVLPAILISKHIIQENRERIEKLTLRASWTKADSIFYLQQKELFGAGNLPGLLKRMYTHPNSIVLAQAVVESGWGQSRFFQEGNNLFGIWSYRPDEPRIEASLTRGEKEVHLRKYENISESISDYFQTIGRSRHYRHFRNARAETDQIQDLLPHLKYYSERRMEYIEQLQIIISQNDLTRYDNYLLDPMYMSDEHPEEDIKNTPAVAGHTF